MFQFIREETGYEVGKCLLKDIPLFMYREVIRIARNEKDNIDFLRKTSLGILDALTMEEILSAFKMKTLNTIGCLK